MRRSLTWFLSLSLLAGCSPVDPSASSSAELVITDRCEISGLGLLVDGDLIAGRVRGSDTGAIGGWTHVDGSEIVLGEAAWILCRINGAYLGDFGGAALLAGRPGYTFRVSVQDFDEPLLGSLAAPGTQTVSATRRYRPSRWHDGHVSLEAGDLVTIPAELPVTVGNAGNQWAWLTFERVGTLDVVVCRYRGGASTPNPTTPEDLAAGASYQLERCTGELAGTPEVVAGDRVEAQWMTLRVQSGAHFLPSRGRAETTVSVDLEVLSASPPSEQDRYRIAVWDDATGERVFFRDGTLRVGDLRVLQLD